MGCTSCSTNKTPGGCKSNGSCGTGGCGKLNVFDWLANMESPASRLRNTSPSSSAIRLVICSRKPPFGPALENSVMTFASSAAAALLSFIRPAPVRNLCRNFLSARADHHSEIDFSRMIAQQMTEASMSPIITVLTTGPACRKSEIKFISLPCISWTGPVNSMPY